jgi:hypothetical protein
MTGRALAHRRDAEHRTLQPALDLLYEVVFSRTDLERCGVLVGRLEPGELPKVAAIIPLRDAARPGRAALGHGEWAHALESMATYYRGLEVVGWWMSRPSGRARTRKADAETHGRFFHAPGQVFLLFDTSARTAAVFTAGDDRRLRCVHRAPVQPRAITGAAAHVAAPAPHHAAPPWAALAAFGGAGGAAGLLLWALSHGLSLPI